MSGITVKELLAACKAEVKLGNGDKVIQISADDEDLDLIEAIISNAAALDCIATEVYTYILVWDLKPWQIKYFQEAVGDISEEGVREYFYKNLKPYLNMTEEEFNLILEDIDDTYCG